MQAKKAAHTTLGSQQLRYHVKLYFFISANFNLFLSSMDFLLTLCSVVFNYAGPFFLK
jgi:hypothetical protein